MIPAKLDIQLYRAASHTITIDVDNSVGAPFEIVGTNQLRIYRNYNQAAILTVALTWNGTALVGTINTVASDIEAGSYPYHLWNVNGAIEQPVLRGQAVVADVFVGNFVDVVGAVVVDSVTYQVMVTGGGAAQTYEVNVKDYGATGDGVTDDYAAIRAAVDSFTTAGGVLFAPVGRYRMTQPLIITNSNISVIGQGGVDDNQVGTTFWIDHNAGDGIWFQGGKLVLKYFNLHGSTTRRAAAYDAADIGLRIEPPDVAGVVFCADIEITKVSSRHHNGHGVVFCGAVRRAEITQLSSRNNKGHGIACSSGLVTGRTNEAFGGIGLMTFNLPNIQACGGNGIAVGDHGVDLTDAFRVLLINPEVSDSATDAAVRFTDHQVYFACNNGLISHGGIRGIQGGGNFSSGIYVEKEQNHIINCRYIDCVRSVDIGIDKTTRGTIVNGLTVAANTIGVPQNPAINIGALGSRSKIYATNQDNITTLVTDAGDRNVIENFGSRSVTAPEQNYNVRGVAATEGFSSFESVSIADDGVYVIDCGADLTSGILIFSANNTTSPAGMAIVRARSSPHAAIVTAINSASLEFTTGILAGTTGADGKLTISTHTDQKIYIENRLGGARTYSFTLLR